MLKKAFPLIFIILSFLGYAFIQFGIDRTEFWEFTAVYSFLFALYLIVLKKYNLLSLGYVIFSAILFRLILLFGDPTLSDDFFRFAWDARLWINGYNPYLYLPSELINKPWANAIRLDETLYHQLNSPDYYTCYPPVHQFLFGAFSLPFSNSLMGQVIGMKIAVFIAEMGTILIGIKLLKHFKQPIHWIAIYALNPLVIIEVMGNLHTEAVVVFFMALMFYGLIKNKIIWSAIAFALAISTKLVPLLLFPILFKYLGFKKGIKFTVVTFAIIVITALPFFSMEIVDNFTQSIQLFIQNFEFNASIYYVLRWFGYEAFGYNVIGNIGWILKLTSLIWILFLMWKIPFQSSLYKINSTSILSQYFTYAWVVYLLLSTVVHPWYLIPLIFFSVFSRLKFPIIWSVLIVWSYSAYQTSAYTENLYLVSLQYVLLGVFMFWEFRRDKGLIKLLKA